jgi:hypothetical protein
MDLEKGMSDVGGKQNNRTFKKRAHRPWETALLETTVEEATLELDNDSLEFDLDLESEPTEDMESFYPEFNFTEDSIETNTAKNPFIESLSQLETINIELPEDKLEIDDVNSELKQEIRNTQQQKKLLVQQISDKSHSSILLGGFFQPQQVASQSDTPAGRKISSLLSDLKIREQKLNSLTSNLKISEAIERAEQAELYKKAAAHGRQAAEQRMRQAVEQANIAAEQFRSAMEQANQAALAQQEEANLRKNAEAQAKEARLRANNAEIELQNERLARLSAEEKAQQAFTVAERTNLLQKQLNETTDQLNKLELIKNIEANKRLEIEKQYDQLHSDFLKIDNEHRLCSSTINNLEISTKQLTDQIVTSQQKIKDFDVQKEKLKAIIAAEQDLRKIAERKYNEALKRAETAEEGWKMEIQQRKIIEERAKRAVAHASRTVMHLLNAPTDSEFSPQSKEKEPNYEEDDFSF